MGNIREEARKFLEQVKPGTDIASKGDYAGLFTRLTGWTHASLQTTWETEDKAKQTAKKEGRSTFGLPTTTTCNAFVGTMGTSIHSPIYLGQFDIAKKLANAGFGDAWVPASSGKRPQCGDVFRPNKFHMGVSFEFVGDTWHTVESGQGGPGEDYTKGFDIIRRKSQPWNPSNLQGWVDIEVLANLALKAPKWMVGWWAFEIKGAKQFVWIPERGRAQRFDTAPQNSKLPPPIEGKKGEVAYDEDQNGVTITWPDTMMPDVLRHLPGVDYMLGSRGADQIQAFKVK